MNRREDQIMIFDPDIEGPTFVTKLNPTYDKLILNFGNYGDMYDRHTYFNEKGQVPLLMIAHRIPTTDN